MIREAGLSADTPILVTNTDSFADVIQLARGDITHGTDLVQTM